MYTVNLVVLEYPTCVEENQIIRKNTLDAQERPSTATLSRENANYVFHLKETQHAKRMPSNASLVPSLLLTVRLASSYLNRI